MANVVIIYTGNVCSTPMIEYARLSKSIYVPGRELFDYYNFSKISNNINICKDLAEIFDALFLRKSCAYLESDGLLNYRGDRAVPSTLVKPHVLFKWRCFPPGAPGSHKIAEVLAANKATPVVMLRSSLLTQAIKVFLSERAYGGRYQQFKTSTMSKKIYESYIEKQKQISIVISDSDLKEIRKIAKDFLNSSITQIDNMHFYFPHVPQPYLIFAEDIFKPLIDFVQYEFALTTLFGDFDPLDTHREPTVRKGGLELSNCANLDMVLQDAKLRSLEERYQAATAGLKNIFTSS